MPLSDRLGSIFGAAGALGGAAAFPGIAPFAGAAGGLAGRELGGALGSYFHTPTPQELAQQAQIQRLQQPTPGINFAPIEQSAMGNFRNRIVPQLAEQYNGQQGAFATAIGQGGSDLAERLAALRSQYDFQGAQMNQNREGMLGSLLSGQQSLGQNQNQFNQMQTQSGLDNLLNSFNQLGQARQFGVQQAGQAATGAEDYQNQWLKTLLGAGEAGAGRGQNFDTVYGAGTSGMLQKLFEASPQLAAKLIPLLG